MLVVVVGSVVVEVTSSDAGRLVTVADRKGGSAETADLLPMLRTDEEPLAVVGQSKVVGREKSWPIRLSCHVAGVEDLIFSRELLSYNAPCAPFIVSLEVSDVLEENIPRLDLFDD